MDFVSDAGLLGVGAKLSASYQLTGYNTDPNAIGTLKLTGLDLGVGQIAGFGDPFVQYGYNISVELFKEGRRRRAGRDYRSA